MLPWGGLYEVITSKEDYKYEDLPDNLKTLFSKLKEIEDCKNAYDAVDFAKKINERDANYLNSSFLDDLRKQPLNFKFAIKNSDVVKFLLLKGADVSLANLSDFEEACHRNYFDIVKILVEHGAYRYNINGIKLAIIKGYTDIVDFLLDENFFNSVADYYRLEIFILLKNNNMYRFIDKIPECKVMEKFLN